MTSAQDSGALAAIHRLFNNQKLRKVLLALRFPLALAALVILAICARPRYFVLGAAISAVGELLQVWCFAALKKKQVLAVKGPYVFVRNPMYLGRYLLILGGVLLAGNLWVVAGFTVLYYFYMVNRVKREEAILNGIFGESYARYCREVNAFLPSFRNVNWSDALFFRWELFFRNHAHWNLLGAILCYAGFYYAAFQG
jgi:steroid 5-alpha reductase family enzyme